MAAGSQESEYSVKAAFLVNFAKYVEWPASAMPAGAPLVIGIVGRDPFGHVIDNLVESRSVGGHRLVVKRVKWSDDLAECRILFVPASEPDAGRLAKLRNRPVLTVGETDGFTKRGGIVNFVLEANKVRFEISAPGARECGLTISSKLLGLARSRG